MAFDLKTAKPDAEFDLKTAKPETEPSRASSYWDTAMSVVNPFDKKSIAAGTNLMANLLEPGSDTEAAVRGATDSASLGVGPKLARWLYGQGEADAQAQAKSEHPLSTTAGNLVGAIPAGLGIARAGLAAGPQVIRQLAGAGVAGAGLGAIQGAASTDKLSDLPANIGEGALIGGGSGAIGQGVASGIAKVAPKVAAAFKPKVSPESVTPSVVIPRVMTAEETLRAKTAPIVQQITLPAGGATLGGLAGYSGMLKGKNTGTDAESSIASRGLDTAQGMLGGAAIGAISKNAKPLATAAIQAVGREAASLGNFVGDEANKGVDLFGKLGKWIAGNPGADEKAVRQAAMAATATPKGRGDLDTGGNHPVSPDTTPPSGGSSAMSDETVARDAAAQFQQAIVPTPQTPMTPSQRYLKYQSDLKGAKTPQERNSLADQFEKDVSELQKNNVTSVESPEPTATIKWKEGDSGNAPMKMSEMGKDSGEYASATPEAKAGMSDLLTKLNKNPLNAMNDLHTLGDSKTAGNAAATAKAHGFRNKEEMFAAWDKTPEAKVIDDAMAAAENSNNLGLPGLRDGDFESVFINHELNSPGLKALPKIVKDANNGRFSSEELRGMNDIFDESESVDDILDFIHTHIDSKY